MRSAATTASQLMLRAVRIRRHVLTLAALVSVAAGCAYYNTFYNAKQYFRQAEEQRLKRRTDRPSQAEIQNYQKAIEKAGKVIQNYPNSRYVDDAILLMGKAFYWRDQLGSAQRKFEELLTYFPDSELAPEAQLWLARCLIAQNQYDEAEKHLVALQSSKDVPGEVRDETYLLLGELYYNRQQYDEAIKAYAEAAKRIGDKRLKAQCYMRLGECATEVEDYATAAEAYRRAVRYTETLENRFQAMLNYGISLREQGKYDEAIKQFERILRDGSLKRYWPDAKYEIGEAAYFKGERDYAVRWLESVIEEHPRSEAAAKAHFLLGQIYLQDFADYKGSKEHFDKVRSAYARAEVVPEALEMSRDLDQLLKLRELVTQQEKQLARGRGGVVQVGERVRHKPGELWWVPDTTLSRRDSLMIFARIDSMVQRGIDADSAAWSLVRQDTLLYWIFHPDSMVNVYTRWVDDDSVWAEIERIQEELDQMTAAERRALAAARAAAKQRRQQPLIEAATPENVAKNKLKLGELFLFRFDEPDTALTFYMDIVEKYPDTPVAPQALYSIAYIFESIKGDTAMADSVRSRLIAKYPDTPQAEHAKRELGLVVEREGPNGARRMYLEAESLLWDEQNPQAALDTLVALVARYPGNPLSPKAVYAAGWICENVLGANEQAAEIYQTLVDKYPDTPYAKRVKALLEEFKRAQEQLQRAEELSQVASADSTAAQRADSLAAPAGDSTVVALLDTGTTENPIADTATTAETAAAEKVDTLPEPVGGPEAVQSKLTIPPQARNAVLPSTVIVQVLVDETGAVRDVRFATPLDNDALEFAAMSAVRAVRWKPGTYQGKPVRAWTQIALDFVKARGK